MTRHEQLRFNRLVRHFVHRFVDHETIAADAEPHQVFVTAVAMLGAAGVTLSVVLVMRYLIFATNLPAESARWLRAGDQLLLVLLMMAITGLSTALAWNALFPDRRDAMVLGPLPIPAKTLFSAKLYAICLFFGVLTGALQLCPGIVAPILMFPDRWYVAIGWQALTLTLASAFVFFGVVAAQGILLITLPYRWFERVSSILQIATLLGSLVLLILTPHPWTTETYGLDWAEWLPPYWFLRFWQTGLGTGSGPLALAAPAGLVVIALAVFRPGYRRALQHAVEGCTDVCTGRHWLPRWGAPRSRAVFLFVARTMSRHRGHRLLLSVYCGLGMAWVLSDIAKLLEGSLSGKAVPPSAANCMIPLNLAFFLMAGIRVVFALPVELKANWLFRLTAPEQDATMQRGVRWFLIAAGIVPLATAPTLLFGWAWGARAAATHLFLFTLESWLLLEVLLRDFHKVPFTCSWLPGQGNLKVKGGTYVILFGGLSSFLGGLESTFIRVPGSPGPFVVSALLLAAILWIRSRRLPAWKFQFEAEDESRSVQLSLAR